jgi:hypothetical protein
MDLLVALIGTVAVLYVLIWYSDVVMAISTAALAGICLLLIDGIVFLLILFLLRSSG